MGEEAGKDAAGFVGKLRDVKSVIDGFLSYELMLDVLIVFLVSYIILALVGTFVWPSISPAFIWLSVLPPLVYIYVQRKRLSIFEVVERGHPWLWERLRTAYDNRGLKNLIVEDLIGGVSGDIDRLRYSSLLAVERIKRKVIAIVLLCFLLVSLAFLNAEVKEDVSDIAGKLPALAGKVAGLGGQGPGGEGEGASGGGEGKGEGTGSGGTVAPVAKIVAGSDFEIKVYQGASKEINVRDVKENEPPFEGQPLFPVEAESAGAYSDVITHREVVKNYFKNLSQSNIV